MSFSRNEYYEKCYNDISRSEQENSVVLYVLSKKENEGEHLKGMIGDVKAFTCKEWDKPSKDTSTLNPVFDWDFNLDGYLFDDLDNGFDIVHMPISTHSYIWNLISENGLEDINKQEGFQKYLTFCKNTGVNHSILKQVGFKGMDLMSFHVEKNQGYEIKSHIDVGESTIVLGENKKSPTPYVTWKTDRNRENGYVDGHYFESKNAAFSDLKKRSISQLNMQISKQMVHLKINKDRTL